MTVGLCSLQCLEFRHTLAHKFFYRHIFWSSFSSQFSVLLTNLDITLMQQCEMLSKLIEP
ncbi:hypothetical protein D7V91_05300 [bacterium 1xD42-67]|nr:hypothetical protein D7V91_05300 [bacterium 1xD42-67]